MKGTILTTRTAALGALLALLMAAFAGLATPQQAKADITFVGPSVTVASTSPPPGGVIYYGITVTTDNNTNSFEIEAKDLTGFDVAATGSLCSALISGTSVSFTPNCSTALGANVVFSQFNENGQGEATVYVGLVVDSQTAVGTTLQPKFVIRNLNIPSTVERTAPARTVGLPTVQVSPTEATVGDTVTVTINLPAGWTCASDTTEADATRPTSCTVGTTGTADILLTNLSVPSTSPTVSNTSLGQPATITFTATVTGVGAATATLNDPKYFGDPSSPVSANDNGTGTDVSATVNVWIGVIVPSPTVTGDGDVWSGSDASVAIANMAGINATGATVTVTFPAEFSSVQVTDQPTNWSCTVTGNTITCTYTGTTPISAGTPVNLLNGGTNGDLKAVISATTAARTFNISASVTFTYPGGLSATKSDTAAVSQSAHGVALSLTATPLTLPSSGTGVVTYTLSVGETPNTISTGNYQVVFNAPSEALQILVATPGSGWNCSTTGLQVTCTSGPADAVGSSGSTIATILVQLPANTNPGPVLRTATASGTYDVFVGNTQTGSGFAAAPAQANVVHPGTGAASVTYNLVFGWNLIAWGGQNNVTVGSPNGLGSIVGDISAVYTFDSATQQWLAWFPGGGPANTLAALEYGKAYFIYVTNPGGATLTVPPGP